MAKPRVVLTRDEKNKIYDNTGLKPVKKSKITLLELCQRQSWLCFWCGRPMTKTDPLDRLYRTLEHVIPVSDNGSGHLPNLRASCRFCNEERGAWQSTKLMAGKIRQLTGLLEGAQKHIQRNKVTMAGRCYYCKARFHVKTWLAVQKEKIATWRKLNTP